MASAKSKHPIEAKRRVALFGSSVPNAEPQKCRGLPAQDQPGEALVFQITDPLERSYQRWSDLFFGILELVRARDRALWNGLLLALREAGLAEWHGDSLTLTSATGELIPSDETLLRAARFKKMRGVPKLRGGLKKGQLRPNYLFILMTYYRVLGEERRQARQGRGSEAAHERAIIRTAAECDYKLAVCKKHLEKAQSLFPHIVKRWKGKGAQWIEVK
jgi:hypothetical protein